MVVLALDRERVYCCVQRTTLRTRGATRGVIRRSGEFPEGMFRCTNYPAAFDTLTSESSQMGLSMVRFHTVFNLLTEQRF